MWAPGQGGGLWTTTVKRIEHSACHRPDICTITLIEWVIKRITSLRFLTLGTADIWDWIIPWLWGNCSLSCRMLSSILGLSPIKCQFPSGLWQAKMWPDLARCPLRSKIVVFLSQWRTTDLNYEIHWQKGRTLENQQQEEVFELMYL